MYSDSILVVTWLASHKCVHCGQQGTQVSNNSLHVKCANCAYGKDDDGQTISIILREVSEAIVGKYSRLNHVYLHKHLLFYLHTTDTND